MPFRASMIEVPPLLFCFVQSPAIAIKRLSCSEHHLTTTRASYSALPDCNHTLPLKAFLVSDGTPYHYNFRQPVLRYIHSSYMLSFVILPSLAFYSLAVLAEVDIFESTNEGKRTYAQLLGKKVSLTRYDYC